MEAKKIEAGVNERIRQLSGMKTAEERAERRQARGVMPFAQRPAVYQAAAAMMLEVDGANLDAIGRRLIGFHATTVADAIADFNRQSGMSPIQVEDMRADGADAFAVASIPGGWTAFGTVHQTEAHDVSIVWELWQGNRGPLAPHEALDRIGQLRERGLTVLERRKSA